MQIDHPERGFSVLNKDGPLDMRMEGRGLSAADVVNSFAEADLADIFWRYGEERHARRVALGHRQRPQDHFDLPR